MNPYTTSYIRPSIGRTPVRCVAPPSASANASTRTGSLLRWTSLLARLLRATSERASTLFAWLFGSENGLTIGDFCATCPTVHPPGYQCERSLTAYCPDCKRIRDLDRFGNCVCGNRSVGAPQLKFPNAHRYNAALARGAKRG